MRLLSRASWIGARVPRLDAEAKAKGATAYPGDFELPGMLVGLVLRSPLPHARILRIDTGRARRVPGVRAVLTAADTLGVWYGPIIEDEQILAQEKVRYVGDEVAAVAAADEDAGREALDLVKVEYEELPGVFDPEEALRPEAPRVHERGNVATEIHLNRGDVEEAFSRAEVVLERKYETQLVHHCYLEPNTCVAALDAEGCLDVWIAHQEPFLARGEMAKALGLPASKIRLRNLPGGGGFGGKCDQKLPFLAALLALKTGRPVRMAYSRREEFEAGRPRLPIVIDLKMGITREGLLVGKQARIVADNGAYSSQGPAVLNVAAIRSDSLYRIPAVKTDAYLVYTNKVPTGAFRGFGNPQAHFAQESLIDELAEAVGMDPLEVRLRNAVQPGDVTAHGWRITACALSECLREVGRAIGWTEKKDRAEQAGSKRRGVGLAAMIHVSGNRAVFGPYDGSAALVKVTDDGHAHVYSPEMDIGQGAETVFAQIAATELGLDIEQVHVRAGSTDEAPYGLGTFASRVTVLGGNAVRLAAMDAARQLREAAAGLLETEACDLTLEGGQVRAPDGRSVTLAEAAHRAMIMRRGQQVLGVGQYDVGFPAPDRLTRYGNASIAYPFGAQAVEVEVDVETGEVRVLRVEAAHDVGRPINPLLAEGQIEGGIVQGIGYALMEEMQHWEGRILNPDFRDYKTPCALDVPPIRVRLVESEGSAGPYGAKGVGEPPLVPTAAAIANAIFDATGVRIRKLPLTAERVWEALAEAGFPVGPGGRGC